MCGYGYPFYVSSTFLSAQEFISKRIHKIAEAQMKIAGDEERQLAIEAGEIDSDGTPMCTVVDNGPSAVIRPNMMHYLEW
ncbi:unnamed protein product [Macrosiphum euphorbiae]|uniref:Uncharacterized protein n=1 Tax=Macrosiphum euphorbiae TaxID=13131 RepID=A0AAV0WDP8_9HEMI|nr:unnamed protein product [Macrosiphum euphorbiae]